MATSQVGTCSKLLLIDMMHLAYRSFYAFSANPLQTRAGVPTSAVFGVASTCLKMLREEKPDYVVVCTDSGEKTFRHLACPQYKSHRRELPVGLEEQLPQITRLFDCLQVKQLQRPGFEADDLIGSLAVKFSSPQVHVSILSKDKDFTQLVNTNVTVLRQDHRTGDIHHMDAAAVVDRMGVPPEQICDYLAIVGDASDNVTGVRGIGPKGAVQLLQAFPTLEAVLANIDQVKSPKHQKLLRAFQLEGRDALAKQLVTIKTDLPVSEQLDDFSVPSSEAICQYPALVDFCREMEITGLLTRYGR